MISRRPPTLNTNQQVIQVTNTLTRHFKVVQEFIQQTIQHTPENATAAQALSTILDTQLQVDQICLYTF